MTDRLRTGSDLGPVISVCLISSLPLSPPLSLRQRLGSQESVNIMLPADIMELFQSEGLHLRRMTVQPWAAHRETRKHSKGIFLKCVRARVFCLNGAARERSVRARVFCLNGAARERSVRARVFCLNGAARERSVRACACVLSEWSRETVEVGCCVSGRAVTLEYSVTVAEGESHVCSARGSFSLIFTLHSNY